MMMWLYQGATVLIGLLVLAGLALAGFSLLTARRHFSQATRPEPLKPWPKVSILKPVEGTGPETYQAFASFCRLDYPGPLEILIGTINPEDPVVAMVSRLQQEFPDRDIRLVLARLQGANRKTSIMEALWQSASGQFLFFSDADVFAPADYLRQLVPQLASPNVGCLTCLPRGIKAETLGARMIALHYGFNFVPQWMLAARTTGIHWAIGHTMAIPRAVLEKLHGFKNFPNHLADDYELGNRVSKLGLRVVVPPLLMDCVMPAESLAQAFVRMQRWKRTIRRSRGLQFFGVILTYPVFWAGLLVLLHPLSGWSWSILGLVAALRCLLAAGLQAAIKTPDWPRAWWLLPVVDILEVLAFFGAYSGASVCWAGRYYTLRRDGTLEQNALKTPLKKRAPMAAAEH
jgi:ceramide glucosyltransferase